MKKITVKLTSQLVEEGFTTGYTVRRAVISKGLPEGARLSGAEMNKYGQLELEFECEDSCADDKDVSIEVTTLQNV